MIPILVDTALASVPVNSYPLTDDTDFKTIEASVLFNAAGLAIQWNFTTVAGVTTQVAVTPTSGGAYDWTNLGNGMYAIEIPASSGASANNDTEGSGYFTGSATGVLPWRGPTLHFAPANVINSLVVGSDLLDVSLVQVAGDAQSATDLKDFADAGYDPATNKVEGVKLADTLTTYTGNTLQTGDTFARLGAPAGASIAADIATKATPAQVNTEVLDVLNVDTFSEPSSVPAATSTLRAKIGWLFLLARNTITQTSTTQLVKADDASTTVGTSTVSDDGSVFTRGKYI